MVPGWDTVRSVYMVESPPLTLVILTPISNHRIMVILAMITNINSLLFHWWRSELHSGEVLCDGKKPLVFLFYHHFLVLVVTFTMRQK